MGRPTARNATASDFDQAAERWAHGFWLWVIPGGIVHWFAGLWWAALLYLLALWWFAAFVASSVQAHRLRKGTYRIPNPNNGAPDGDALNR